MRQASGRKAAAGLHPATSGERRTQGQQQERARAEIGQQIERRDAPPGTMPIHQKKRGLENDQNEDEIDEASARKQVSHA